MVVSPLSTCGLSNAESWLGATLAKWVVAGSGIAAVLDPELYYERPEVWCYELPSPRAGVVANS
jgi:hypothetical protein